LSPIYERTRHRYFSDIPGKSPRAKLTTFGGSDEADWQHGNWRVLLCRS
jgi:hypothetical protein